MTRCITSSYEDFISSEIRNEESIFTNELISAFSNSINSRGQHDCIGISAAALSTSCAQSRQYSQSSSVSKCRQKPSVASKTWLSRPICSVSTHTVQSCTCRDALHCLTNAMYSGADKTLAPSRRCSASVLTAFSTMEEWASDPDRRETRRKSTEPQNNNWVHTQSRVDIVMDAIMNDASEERRL